tara:strand:+ start:225 stop:1253 length:1029 start_codon:yes stop_codon:yes gene_type:complete
MDNIEELIVLFHSQNKKDVSGKKISRLGFLAKLKDYLGNDIYKSYVNHLHRGYEVEEIQKNIRESCNTFGYRINIPVYIVNQFQKSHEFSHLNKYLRYVDRDYSRYCLDGNYSPLIEIRFTILANDVFDKFESIITDDRESRRENIMRIKNLYESIKNTNAEAKKYNNIWGLYEFRHKRYYSYYSVFCPDKVLYLERLNYNKKRFHEEEKNREKRLAISNALENKNHYLRYTNSHFVLKKIIDRIKKENSNIKVNLNDVKEKLIKVVSGITNEELERHIAGFIDDCKRNELKIVGVYWDMTDMSGRNDEIRQRLKNHIRSYTKSAAKLPPEVLLNIYEFSGV